ncbi:MAG: hypothetical protein M3N21_01530 [Actinomycetota bacterium]|nr:hypothetical protein [Actinomycetota bacterium]
MKKIVLATTLVGAAVVAGALGATMFGTANAASGTPAPGVSPGSPGTLHSNTDPTHEAGESAARQAQEKTADAGGVAPEGARGGHSNTDPAHEAGESAARQAQEKARDAGLPATAPSPGTSG